MGIDVDLVRRLIDAQFPQWSGLAVRPVERDGWDNTTFRLGERMSVRLPSAAPYSAQVAKEHRWLPRLAPLLPLPIPTPLAMGEPGEGYPWRWSVYRWLEGEDAGAAPAGAAPVADLAKFAATLAGFLRALQSAGTAGAPRPGAHNFHRGGSLTVYDAETRESIAALAGTMDAASATAVWEKALSTTWTAEPVWVHGDVAVGNLLVTGGRLGAVIDFGCSAVGDPACDLVIAWTLFSGESRKVFQAGLPLGHGTWARARGWALWKALISLARGGEGDPQRVHEHQSVIEGVIADWQSDSG